MADGAYRGRDAKGRREPISRIRLGLRCHTAQGPGRTVNDEAGAGAGCTWGSSRREDVPAACVYVAEGRADRVRTVHGRGTRR